MHKLLQDDKGLVALLAAGAPPDPPRGSDAARATLAATEAVVAAAAAGVPASGGLASGAAFVGKSAWTQFSEYPIKSDTWGHCLPLRTSPCKYVYVQVYVCVCARTYVCRTYTGRWRHSNYTARARRAEGIQRREGPLSAGVVTLSHSTAPHIMKLRCKETFRPRM